MKFAIFPNHSYVDLGLYQFGSEICDPCHSFGPAKRNHYLFHFILSGRGELHADDSKGVPHSFKVHAGEGFMLFPGQISMYVADRSNPWEYAWLEFDGLRVKQALDAAGFSHEEPVYRTNSPELRDRLKDEMLYIVAHSEASHLELIGHLYLFMDLLTRSSLNTGKTTDSRLRDFYIKEAIAYIEGNSQRDITIEEISDALGLNRSYFGKIFREATGKSPQRFLMNYRMIKAAELLVSTNLAVKEIGTSVGYENQLHFSRAFKAVYGVSPREWRRNASPSA